MVVHNNPVADLVVENLEENLEAGLVVENPVDSLAADLQAYNCPADRNYYYSLFYYLKPLIITIVHFLLHHSIS